ncbi:MAG: 4-(cytidine 5'-diphospho)-2-C-methyl-D-erythritol kinase [Proteobacteria bacterium]|nr:4-(cytidine 5'-diphospho)-2-C-methyl-D-erythritol kinase [Pseudomonadota bacterium]MDA1332001.1 4-(cytidine 5'-diphospho)-2-C-methyl-D-erythritol kinase [Pseudomonadota bacterium]
MREGFDYFPAPAKLNLFLRIIGKREDGYHSLQTVFRLIDFADSIGFRAIPQNEVRRVSQHPWSDTDDLAVRAARLLVERYSVNQGVELDVVKRIPHGAGLGGGSSDAATVLLVMNKLWALNLKRQELQDLAILLGADVPFFVFGRNAFAEGIGEHLSPLDLAEACYLVVYPNCSVSTSSVFGDLELTRNSKPIKIADFSSYEGRNDLQDTACRLYPEVQSALEWLGQYGAAAMSGSGSSIFCQFADPERAKALVAEVPSRWFGFAARGLDHHPLCDLMGD